MLNPYDVPASLLATCGATEAVIPLSEQFWAWQPKMFENMQAASKERLAQIDALPKEKQLADLGDKELAKLAKLMKVDVSVLTEQRDMWNDTSMEATDAAAVSDDYAADGAVDAAADAADAAAMAVENSEYDRSNWSDADRQRVEELEAAYLEAEAAAVEKARERLGNKPLD